MYEWSLGKISAISGYTQLIRAIPGDRPIVHVHGSFGDVYCQMAVIAERLIDGEAINIIVDARYQELVRQVSDKWPAKIGVFYADGPQVNALLSSLGVIGRFDKIPIRPLPTLYPMISQAIDSGLINYCEFLRLIIGSKHTGKLPPLETDTKLASEAREVLTERMLPIGRTLLFSTDNNSQMEFPEAFWIEVVKQAESIGWTCCLNDSGTLSAESARILREFNIPRVKVPPHLAVTLPTVAGGYVVGTNGFATIQALFNEKCRGIHFINCINQVNGGLFDKFGNRIPVERMRASVNCGPQFAGLQAEINVMPEMSINEIKTTLSENLRCAGEA